MKGYSYVFEAVIENYIRRYLGVEPPTPKTMTPVKEGCGCVECEKLDKFLMDPQRETGHFTYKQSIRTHLEKQIGHRLDLGYETEIKGSPYTLVVHKNPTEFAAKRRVVEYRKRYDEVRSDIKSLGLSALNEMFGTAGEELIDLKSVRNKLIASGTNQTPLASIPATNANVDLIDLTEDKAPKARNIKPPNDSLGQMEEADGFPELDQFGEAKKYFGIQYNEGDKSWSGTLSIVAKGSKFSKIAVTPLRPRITTKMALKEFLVRKVVEYKGTETII